MSCAVDFVQHFCEMFHTNLFQCFYQLYVQFVTSGCLSSFHFLHSIFHFLLHCVRSFIKAFHFKIFVSVIMYRSCMYSVHLSLILSFSIVIVLSVDCMQAPGEMFSFHTVPSLSGASSFYQYYVIVPILRILHLASLLWLAHTLLLSLWPALYTGLSYPCSFFCHPCFLEYPLSSISVLLFFPLQGSSSLLPLLCFLSLSSTAHIIIGICALVAAGAVVSSLYNSIFLWNPWGGQLVVGVAGLWRTGDSIGHFSWGFTATSSQDLGCLGETGAGFSHSKSQACHLRHTGVLNCFPQDCLPPTCSPNYPDLCVGRLRPFNALKGLQGAGIEPVFLNNGKSQH